MARKRAFVGEMVVGPYTVRGYTNGIKGIRLFVAELPPTVIEKEKVVYLDRIKYVERKAKPVRKAARKGIAKKAAVKRRSSR